eukprot:365425-Chlamydomonas_euryale.AAC.6
MQQTPLISKPPPSHLPFLAPAGFETCSGPDTGKPLFGTLISLLHDGVPVLGIIDQPILKVGCTSVAVGRRGLVSAGDHRPAHPQVLGIIDQPILKVGCVSVAVGRCGLVGAGDTDQPILGTHPWADVGADAGAGVDDVVLAKLWSLSETARNVPNSLSPQLAHSIASTLRRTWYLTIGRSAGWAWQAGRPSSTETLSQRAQCAFEACSCQCGCGSRPLPTRCSRLVAACAHLGASTTDVLALFFRTAPPLVHPELTLMQVACAGRSAGRSAGRMCSSPLCRSRVQVASLRTQTAGPLQCPTVHCVCPPCVCARPCARALRLRPSMRAGPASVPVHARGRCVCAPPCARAVSQPNMQACSRQCLVCCLCARLRLRTSTHACRVQIIPHATFVPWCVLCDTQRPPRPCRAQLWSLGVRSATLSAPCTHVADLDRFSACSCAICSPMQGASSAAPTNPHHKPLQQPLVTCAGPTPCAHPPSTHAGRQRDRVQPRA